MAQLNLALANTASNSYALGALSTADILICHSRPTVRVEGKVA